MQPADQNFTHAVGTIRIQTRNGIKDFASINYPINH